MEGWELPSRAAQGDAFILRIDDDIYIYMIQEILRLARQFMTAIYDELFVNMPLTLIGTNFSINVNVRARTKWNILF